MATKVVPTEELLLSLRDAQARHTIAQLQQNLEYGRWGDDHGDDTTAALDCMTALHNMSCDQTDLGALDKWLNTPASGGYQGADVINTTSGQLVRLHYMGCDGVCPELYELDCPALPKDGNID